jgi:hypothetical protein
LRLEIGLCQGVPNTVGELVGLRGKAQQGLQGKVSAGGARRNLL